MTMTQHFLLALGKTTEEETCYTTAKDGLSTLFELFCIRWKQFPLSLWFEEPVCRDLAWLKTKPERDVMVGYHIVIHASCHIRAGVRAGVMTQVWEKWPGGRRMTSYEAQG